MQDGTNIELKQRNIILVLFPFSDFNEFKKRPALVLSNNEYNKKHKDILICGITSQINPKSDLIFNNNDLEAGSLDYESEIKFDKIYLIKKEKVYSTLCTLNKEKYSEVYTKICDLIS